MRAKYKAYSSKFVFLALLGNLVFIKRIFKLSLCYYRYSQFMWYRKQQLQYGNNLKILLCENLLIIGSLSAILGILITLIVFVQLPSYFLKIQYYYSNFNRIYYSKPNPCIC